MIFSERANPFPKSNGRGPRQKSIGADWKKRERSGKFRGNPPRRLPLAVESMPMIYQGSHSPPPGRFALVAASFNREVVDKLVAGALAALKEHGVADAAVDLAWVPGSFEIP